LKDNEFDHRLQVIVESRQVESVTSPPLPERRIFTNRNIKLSKIKALGFDLDFTLAQYKQAPLDELTMKLTLSDLVGKYGYPESILSVPFVEAFAIRGLVIDTELGNVLKMDKFKYVSLAYHGLQQVSAEDRRRFYADEKVNFQNGRFRAVDTLFELEETYLFSAVMDHLERKLNLDVDYKKLFNDIRNTVDLKHRDGSLKNEIMAHPEHYLVDDPLLITALHRFFTTGKILFVVTNSEPVYSQFVLDYLFRNAGPFFGDWRDCFKLVCCDSRKPLFFGKGRPVKVHQEAPSHIFSGGNINYVENCIGCTGDEILYVGDHIYGDILKSKRSTSWRTCMIVPELADQIQAEFDVREKIRVLEENQRRFRDLSMSFQHLSNQIQLLHQFKETEADDLGQEQLTRLDSEVVKINRQLEHNDSELSKILYESRNLRREISKRFNPYWGRLFKTGDQLSAFAEQIRDYACLYTSAISNFSFYPSQSYLRSTVSPMPHEYDLVHAIDFDKSHELNGDLKN